MSYWGIGAFVVSVAGTAYSAITTNRAHREAAQVDEATAEFNAKYDESLAAQLDFDTLQNVRVMRDEGDSYISRQAASYAAAGVLATSGSALHAQIINAGKIEQRIQQEYVNSQQKQMALHLHAKAGIAMGEAQATAERISGKLALVNGASKIASTTYNAYDAGVFS
jgi:hypothetical protein